MGRHDIGVDDRVRFTSDAVRKFREADGRRRFTVLAVRHTPGFAYWDCELDDGSTWANQWLERLNC
ncbi:MULTISPECIES: SPRY domain-containing protein [Mycolicibacter]|uniref:Uncharacterized protein n=2 Tax=Mycolicibacter TaxID=1073531 RepID=A0ABU5XM90_9MYCO|nr:MULTISPECIES: hypothetical protein [unclassified Mycolicibacter]MEB3023391.1 hypothetical protein [Mycolicibacter sp. MYC098]MEB3033733.1 hypothetical protein [Mycolicibacter sp. MYC340]